MYVSEQTARLSFVVTLAYGLTPISRRCSMKELSKRREKWYALDRYASAFTRRSVLLRNPETLFCCQMYYRALLVEPAKSGNAGDVLPVGSRCFIPRAGCDGGFHARFSVTATTPSVEGMFTARERKMAPRISSVPAGKTRDVRALPVRRKARSASAPHTKNASP